MVKHRKIADEVKTLTTKLEDSFRTFMVQTERPPCAQSH